jgi:glycerophosphoryl diester phosphodiesterase
MLKNPSDSSGIDGNPICKCPEPDKPTTWAFFSAPKNEIDVIAHRGGADQWPGETIFAFNQARTSGVDVLELDIWGTSDHPTELVLMHWSKLKKATDGNQRLPHCTLAELQGLNAAFRWTPDGGETFPLRKHQPRIGVARLADVFKQFEEMRMVIELKQKQPSIVEPFLNLIRDYGMRDKVLIASFYSKVLREIRSKCPHIATSTSSWETLRFYVQSYLFKGNYQPSAQAIQMRSRFPLFRSWLLSRGFVRRAHDLGYKVHAWTVDAPNDMQRAIVCGVDGIITDFPGALLAILQEPERKNCLPTERFGEMK